MIYGRLERNSSRPLTGAFVELFADDSRLRRDLVKASKLLESWGQSISSIGNAIAAAGAAVVAPLTVAATGFALMGSEMQRASERTGVSVDRLSALAGAADQSGISLEQLEAMLTKFEKGLFQAGEGSEQMRRALQLLGVSLSALHGQNPEQQISTLADAFANLKDNTQRVALATELFGRGAGTQFLNFAKNGSAGIRELVREQVLLGNYMTKDQAEAATNLERAFKTLWNTLKYAAVTIGSALAPAMMEGAARMRDWVVGAKTWLKENNGLVLSAFKLAKAIIPVGLGLFAAGTALSYLGTGMGAATKATIGLLSALSRGPGIVDALIKTVWGLTAGLASTLLGIISPATFVVAAIVGIGYAFLKFSSEGAAAIEALKTGWTNIAAIGKETFGGIVDALKAGELELALKIAWAGAKAITAEAAVALKMVWIEFKYWLMGLWENATWENIWNMVSDGFEHAIKFMTQLWNEFTDFISGKEYGVATLNPTLGRNRQAPMNLMSPKEQELSGIRDAADAARAELAALNDEAKKKLAARQAAAKADADKFMSGGQGGGQGIMPGPSAGTFNPFEAMAMGIGGKSIAERQAEIAERQRELAWEQKVLLQRIAASLDQGLQ